jgi:hypothetical protein
MIETSKRVVPLPAESLSKIFKVINHSALLESNLSQHLGKQSFTKPSSKAKNKNSVVSANSVVFDILRNLSIEIWTQSKILELEMLSHVAYCRILT